jgi:tyrosyl-tRNA synthetase
MTIEEQLAYLTNGCVDVVRRDELRKKLERAEKTCAPLVVKVGFDPTAPDLHLGHTVLIRKMKHFQDLGHTVVYVVGAFTALIGDPTGRSKTRPPLTPEKIAANAETYTTQVFKILDPAKTVVRFNSEWLDPLGSVGWIRLAAKYNVAQMLERREFKTRYEVGKPIAVHEFLYPLGQAYDSVFLSRRGARRHRSAVQPERRARHHAGLRSRARAAGRDDDAAAGGAGRRREDVEEPGTTSA